MRMPNKQRGVTLLVALIMLIVITMMVITSANLGTGSLQTVSNMQSRNEAVAAAQEALEGIVSNKRFFQSPATVFTTPCGGSYNTKCVDSNSDGTDDIIVTLTPNPTCVQARILPGNSLVLADPEQAGCATQAEQGSFGQGGSTAPSECAESMWEIRAVATDNVTETSVTVTQGIAVSVSRNDVDTSCP